jgi:hypothetical protein
MKDATIYGVITADIVGSRKAGAFHAQRDKKLQELSSLHRRKKLVLSPYVVTAWDEFQVILSKPEHLPRVIFDLRRVFYPFQLRIAAGIGTVSNAHRRPINRYAGGEAFERARKAADRLKKGTPKYLALTSIESGNETFDVIANTIYHLHDALLERTTQKQWMAINTQLATGRQELAATNLNVDASTLSRTLKRAHYWHIVETMEAMCRIIKTYF